jgi:hypothetical protein
MGSARWVGVAGLFFVGGCAAVSPGDGEAVVPTSGVLPPARDTPFVRPAIDPSARPPSLRPPPAPEVPPEQPPAACMGDCGNTAYRLWSGAERVQLLVLSDTTGTGQATAEFTVNLPVNQHVMVGDHYYYFGTVDVGHKTSGSCCMRGSLRLWVDEEPSVEFTWDGMFAVVEPARSTDDPSLKFVSRCTGVAPEGAFEMSRTWSVAVARAPTWAAKKWRLVPDRLAPSGTRYQITGIEVAGY